MTGQDLTATALKAIGVLGAGETSSAEDAEDSRDLLNLMVDEFGLDRLWLHTVVRTTKTLAAGTASYTIGTGGSINVQRPTWIDRARLVIDTAAATPTEIPQEIFTDQKWQEISQKTMQSGLSQGIFYDHAWSAGLGNIYPWPIPNVGTTQLVLYTPGEAVAEFADLTTDYTFPRGYKSALVYNLAVRLTVPFGRPLTGVLANLASESLARVKRANTRVSELRCEPAITGRGARPYNIFSNQ